MRLILSTTLLLVTLLFSSCSKSDDPTKITVTGVTIKESTVIAVGTSETLTPVVMPEDSSNKSVTWSSTDPTIASVDKDGVVKGLKDGNTTIVATTVDGGKTDECAVTVKDALIAVTGITIDKDAIILNIDETETLSATVAPENAANKAVTWSSTDPTIASVDKDGVVKGLKDGNTTIVATTVDGGKTDECAVTIKTAVINYLGTAFNTQPEFFTPLAETGNTAYVTFTPNECYTLGTNGKIGKSALVYNQKLSDTDLKVKLTIGGGTTDAISIGYVTDFNDLSTFVKVATINYDVSMPYYILNSVNIPSNGYLTIYYTPKETWNNNSIKRLQAFAN